MKYIISGLGALLLLTVASVALPVPAPSVQAQTLGVTLNCPLFGGTCEAFPQLEGFQYFYRSQGNAVITSITPVTSPVATVSCIPLLPQTGQVTVTVIAPGGQSTTLSAAVCPGRPFPVSPF